MARKNRRATKKAPPARSAGGPQALRFTAVNGALAAAGLVVLALAYWLLAQGSVTAAPLLLVLGYVVLLPLAIIL
ncbi:MAG: hypothetical protein KY453_07050 [Gemmatimonadetes bacterium]|nr:hypothetical protein [Gemmatimonadota bacterium]